MASEVIIVSGLPRSGTSLMMQMLDAGGIEVVTDRLRTADADNPKGYYEFERVKQVKQDASWLEAARGKAVKMVSPLLYDLPPMERYRIIFMERDLDEVLLSQEKMLQRLGRPAQPAEAMKRSYTLHLERLHDWLGRQTNVVVLRVGYRALIQESAKQAERICNFLACRADLARMVRSVDPSLYRNRKPEEVPSTP
jgi:hypothetical protein